MKKNKLFRLLTVALALVFICQFAIPAFALAELDENAKEQTSYYNDSGGNGYIYYFRVEKYAGTSFREGIRALTQKKYHTQGTPTHFYAGYYEIYSASGLMNSGYSDIRTLAQSMGIKPSFSLNAYTNIITVPAESVTGYFSLKADFFDYSGEYEVNVDRGDGIIEGEEFDYYPYAAQETSGITGYIYCP